MKKIKKSKKTKLTRMQRSCETLELANHVRKEEPRKTLVEKEDILEEQRRNFLKRSWARMKKPP